MRPILLWVACLAAISGSNPSLLRAGPHARPRAALPPRASPDGLLPLLRLRGGRATALGQRLQQLQYVAKKDPGGYAREVIGQEKSFQAELRSWELTPEAPHTELGELAVFLSHMTGSYPEELAGFPNQLVTFVRSNHTAIDREARYKLCTGIALLCARHLVTVDVMCNLFFTLFTLPDKKLRVYLYTSVLGAIKRANAKSVDQAMNRKIQRELAAHLQGTDPKTGRLAINLFVEMYKRRMWDDDHAVNIIGAACFSRLNKVRGTAVAFLLGDEGEDSDDEEDDFGIKRKGEPEGKRVKVTQLLTAKKRKKKELRKALLKQTKEDRELKLHGKRKKNKPKFAVLDMLHDPQSFAERMLQTLQQMATRLPFAHKLMMMELISRLIGTHRLILLEFFDLLKRYMMPAQEEVHQILAFAAQSMHDLTPPEIGADVVRTIVDRFINDHSKTRTIAIGLHAVREACLRQPLSMEADLLSDLTAYAKHADKSVVNAARALLRTYRELNPSLLKKKERGRAAQGKAPPMQYGETRSAVGVDGAELLDGDAEEEEEERREEESFESLGDIDVSSGLSGESVVEKDSEALDGGVQAWKLENRELTSMKASKKEVIEYLEVAPAPKESGRPKAPKKKKTEPLPLPIRPGPLLATTKEGKMPPPKDAEGAGRDASSASEEGGSAKEGADEGDSKFGISEDDDEEEEEEYSVDGGSEEGSIGASVSDVGKGARKRRLVKDSVQGKGARGMKGAEGDSAGGGIEELGLSKDIGGLPVGKAPKGAKAGEYVEARVGLRIREAWGSAGCESGTITKITMGGTKADVQWDTGAWAKGYPCGAKNIYGLLALSDQGAPAAQDREKTSLDADGPAAADLDSRDRKRGVSAVDGDAERVEGSTPKRARVGNDADNTTAAQAEASESSDGSDEAVESFSTQPPRASAKARDPSQRADMTRVLSEADWETIRRLKRSHDDGDDEPKARVGVRQALSRIDPSDFVTGRRRNRRALKEERIEAKQAEKSKTNFGKKNLVGTRNAEKRKEQPYAMVRHKMARAKAKAPTRPPSKRMEKKQQRGHFHKKKKKKQ